MATRHPNYRLAKIHRNYKVEEIAKLFGNHRNTVREWVKGGLPTIDRRRLYRRSRLGGTITEYVFLLQSFSNPNRHYVGVTPTLTNDSGYTILALLRTHPSTVLGRLSPIFVFTTIGVL